MHYTEQMVERGIAKLRKEQEEHDIALNDALSCLSELKIRHPENRDVLYKMERAMHEMQYHEGEVYTHGLSLLRQWHKESVWERLKAIFRGKPGKTVE